MPGDNGKPGVIYTLGAKGEELYFTLESAEFALRSMMQEETVLAKAGERLLVVTFAVQNPQKSEMGFSWGSFKFTVVSPDDQNFGFDGYVYHPDRKVRLDMSLKPAQKVRAVAVIPIYGKGPVVKLMVQRGNPPVLRYTLRDKVKPLTDAFMETGGIDTKDSAMGTIGSATWLGNWDLTVEKVETTSGKLGNYDPGDDNKLLVATVLVRNPTQQKRQFTWSTFQYSMTDTNGEPIEWVSDVFRMSADSTLDMELEPSKEIRARVIFKAPKSAKPAELTLFDQPFSQRKLKMKVPGA